MSKKAARLHTDASRADGTASDAWSDMQDLNSGANWAVDVLLPSITADRHRRVGE